MLAAPFQLEDRPALEARREAVGKREAKVRPMRDHALEASALHDGLKDTANRFDLRKLRHAFERTTGG